MEVVSPVSYLTPGNLVQWCASLALMFLAYLGANLIASKVGKLYLLPLAIGAGLALLLVPQTTLWHQVALYLFCGAALAFLSRTLHARFPQETPNKMSYLLIPVVACFIIWRRIVGG